MKSFEGFSVLELIEEVCVYEYDAYSSEILRILFEKVGTKSAHTHGQIDNHADEESSRIEVPLGG